MESLLVHKNREITATPVLLFEVQLPDGQTQRWSTHKVSIGSATYQPRVLAHNVFEFATASDQGVDAIPKISMTLANADGLLSQLERSVGWKGSSLRVTLIFVDLSDDQPATDTMVLFRGLLNPPEEIAEDSFRLSAVNRMSLQRVLLPSVRIQRRCPWDFPQTEEDRSEAVAGGQEGPFSRFFRCGYSPEQAGGAGNLDSGEPYSTCNYTRNDCTARGMFSVDAQGRPTARFGGIEFVPASVLVRTAGDKNWHHAAVLDNSARYNDVVPLLYGTAWYSPPVVFSRNDGNITYLEVLLGLGEIEQVLKVLVNDVDVPLGINGRNMTGTGWYNVVSQGTRNGGFNLNFRNSNGEPLGDPYGSMAYLSVAIPGSISDGRTLPRIRVLLSGLRLETFDQTGAYRGTVFTNNPAWVLLDVLRRCGWTASDVDLTSFARVAGYCDELVSAVDIHGNPVQVRRFQCNLVLQRRRTAADVVRGIRNSARLLLTYSQDGLLRLAVEDTIANQQPERAAGSNATTTVAGGWPAYEFGDQPASGGGILRRSNGSSSLRVFSRPTNDTPNRFTVEFQDELNEYQQDSLSVVDVDDVRRVGQELTGPMYATGLANFSQAGRILKYYLDRSLFGNTFVEFETTVRGVGLQPGDLITLTYLREGFQRQPFRVLRVAPSLDFRSARLVAQIHRDAWYADTNTTSDGGPGTNRQPETGFTVPRPLVGSNTDADGHVHFEISNRWIGCSDGGAKAWISVRYTPPSAANGLEPGIPSLGLSPTVSHGGGLAGNQILYYAISAVSGAGDEGGLSFVARASLGDSSDYSVTLTGLRFPENATAFRVYRGTNPQQLLRIAHLAPVTPQFIDFGLPAMPAGPPDPLFHHATFYWRWEYQPETPASLHGPAKIGHSPLQMLPGEHVGRIVRITRGKGWGQERIVGANTSNEVTVSRPWYDEPDGSSYWVIAEGDWRAATAAANSPAEFEVPYRVGATLHITGRAATAASVESVAELAIVTRWTLGEPGALPADDGPPPPPEFSLSLPGGTRGMLELSGISFGELTNTQGIATATATIYYWNELSHAPPVLLAAPVDPTDAIVVVATPHPIRAGSYVQMDSEVLLVTEVLPDPGELVVVRGVHGSVADAHAGGGAVFLLDERVVIVPFPRSFFGSPASGGWKYPIAIPSARIASAEVFVTNGLGNSATKAISVTNTADRGLRTLSGGQISFTISGFLAVQDYAAPDVIIDRDCVVGYIQAILHSPPSGGAPGVVLRLRLNGVAYCTVTIGDQSVVSEPLNGFGLSPLRKGSHLSLDIVSVGQVTPGQDLTLVLEV